MEKKETEPRAIFKGIEGFKFFSCAEDPVQIESRSLPLGDTSLMSGIVVPACEKCGTGMEPKVFFGQIYGWRCPACNPIELKQWSAND